MTDFFLLSNEFSQSSRGRVFDPVLTKSPQNLFDG